jgi:hypothetical protein
MVGISCFVSWNEELTADKIPAYAALRALGKPMALSQWGPRRGLDQVGTDQPPGDNCKLLRGIERSFPQITWWMNWNMAYAISSVTNGDTHATELLSSPQVVNPEDLAWRWRGGGFSRGSRNGSGRGSDARLNCLVRKPKEQEKCKKLGASLEAVLRCAGGTYTSA